MYHGYIELTRFLLNRDFGAKHDFTMEGSASRFHAEALSDKVTNFQNGSKKKKEE